MPVSSPIRRGFPLLAVAFALAICQSTPVPAAAEDNTNKKLYPKIMKASVYVVFPKGPAHAGKIDYETGTGWVVDVKRRLVVTNCHVVRNEKQVTVFFPAYVNQALVTDRQVYLQQATRGGGIRARVLARTVPCDLALIQLDHLPQGAKALSLAGHSVRPGERVHSLGNPSASSKLWRFAPWKVASVSFVHIKTGKDNYHFMLETRAILTQSAEKLAESGGPGASGGPLVNDRGELVGVCQGMAERAGLKSSIFVDVSVVKPFLQKHAVKLKRPADGDTIVKTRPASSRDGPDKQELVAKAKLNLANMLAKDGKVAKARERYQDIITGFPRTRAAEEARRLLDKLAK